MSFDEIVRSLCVRAPMQAATKAEAIDELCGVIAERQGIPTNKRQLADAVTQRDALGLPHRLAGAVFPHAASSLIGRATLAVGKCVRSIDWEGTGAQDIRLVFLLLVPDGENAAVLIMELARRLNNDAVIARLHSCETESHFRHFFLGVGNDLDVPEGLGLAEHIRDQTGSIQALAWAPEGDAIACATANQDHVVRVWKSSGELHGELKGHKGTVLSLAWTSDGERLATGSEDGTALVWRLANLVPEKFIDARTPIHGVAWSSDNRRLALAGHVLGVERWERRGDTNRWSRLPILAGSNIVPAFCVRWSPDGELLAAAGGRGYADVQIWDGTRPHEVARLKQGREPLFAIAWSPDSSLLAVGDYDGRIFLWNRSDWNVPSRQLHAHGRQVTSLAFSCDGNYLASKSEDGTVKLWCTRTWDAITQLLDPTTDSPWAPLDFHPHELRLATLGGAGDSIRIWQISPAKLTQASSNVISTPPARAESVRVPSAIVQAVSEKRAILFAGAGISAKWIDVSTGTLKEELAAEIRLDYKGYDIRERSFEVVADEYASLFGLEQLTTKLADLIPQDREPSPEHIAAARMFGTIITTNWDVLFETAYRYIGRSPRTLASNEDAADFHRDRATVIKIHGTADRPSTLVATEQQYERYHLTHERMLQRVVELMRDNIVVFVGYGLRDEHVRRLIASIRDEQGSRAKPAWAIGFYDKVRTEVLRRRGIDVIKCNAEQFLTEL